LLQQSVTVATSQSTPVDPDWLLSSTVQSAAVLVAIIGGFLVSRLVTLSAERGALIQRRHHRKEFRELKQDMCETVHTERLVVSTEWFIKNHRSNVLAKRGEIDVEALLDDFIPRGSSKEEMRPVGEELISSVKAAFSDILALYPRDAPLPQTSDELSSEGITIPAGSEDVYVTVADYIARSTEARRRSTWDSSSIATLAVPTPDIVYERQDARIAKETDLQSEIRTLDKEIALIDEELSELGKPEGIKGSIAVLMYLTLVGIALPTILMALRPVPDGPLSRAAVVAAFISGLAVLVGYLMRRVKSLKPPN
jgi:hypothetical protein